MVKLRMAQHLNDAVKFVEQGRILTSVIYNVMLVVMFPTSL